MERRLGTTRDRIRVPLIGFDVDEDTLYNVFDALHSHPELRELAGREEGSVLFDGPERVVRKRMRRTEVWLPWERGIHAALAGGTPTVRRRARRWRTVSGDGDRRGLTDHA